MVDLGLRLGDCLEAGGLPSLPDRSVDHVITDPPYSAEVQDGARSLHDLDDNGQAPRRDFEYLPLSSDLRVEVAQEIARVCRRWALVFCDVESLDLWRNDMEACGMRYVRCGAWVRHAGPQRSGDRPGMGFEAIAIFHAAGGRMRWNGGGRGGVWHHPVVATGARKQFGHKTPKPLPLMIDLLRDFTRPGELVCDPFAGSGTTGVAARHLGRRFVGWELQEKFYRPAARRIDRAKEQLDLFAPARRRRPAQQLALGG